MPFTSPRVGDGVRVLVTTSIEDVSSTLTITSVKPEDAGRYSCTGTNGAGTSVRSTVVTVLCESLISGSAQPNVDQCIKIIYIPLSRL